MKRMIIIIGEHIKEILIWCDEDEEKDEDEEREEDDEREHLHQHHCYASFYILSKMGEK